MLSSPFHLKLNSRCAVPELCDQKTLDAMTGWRDTVCRACLLAFGFFFYYLSYRSVRQKQRNTRDVEYAKSLMFGTKEE